VPHEMAINLEDFFGNDQLIVHKMKKMTDKQMEINNNVLDILNKFANFYLFVIYHEHEEEIWIWLDEK
jgi:hypothetical protein